MGLRNYEECNIPEIDTSDSPHIPRRKRRGINVRAEVEVRVGRESWDQRHGNGTGKWAPQRLQGYSDREKGGGSREYGIQVEGRNRGTGVENWD